MELIKLDQYVGVTWNAEPCEGYYYTEGMIKQIDNENEILIIDCDDELTTINFYKIAKMMLYFE